MLTPDAGWAEADILITRLMGQSLHGLRKGRTLYDLGRLARAGAIVEIGVYLGAGMIALGLGTRDGYDCPLYAVDDYTEKGGWIFGEHYGPEDLTKFLIHMGAAMLHPTLIRQECQQAAASWDQGPIALLVWDVANFGRLAADFAAWAPHIMPDGVLAIRDIDDYRFGAQEVVAAAVNSGAWTELTEWPGFILSVRKV